MFSDIIIPLIPILLPVIIALAVILYHASVDRSPINTQQLITTIAATVVPGVEQAYQQMAGQHKKAIASQVMQSTLKQMHVSAHPEHVDLAIEAVVHKLNKKKEPPVVVKPVISEDPQPIVLKSGPQPTMTVEPDGSISIEASAAEA